MHKNLTKVMYYLVIDEGRWREHIYSWGESIPDEYVSLPRHQDTVE